VEKTSYKELEKENKELKGELEARLKLLDILTDSVNDVVFILDPDSKIIEVNKRVEEYGYKTTELRGKPFPDFVPDNFKEIARQVVIEKREKYKKLEMV
jgi:PAS domain S-box-containing protein